MTVAVGNMHARVIEEKSVFLSFLEFSLKPHVVAPISFIILQPEYNGPATHTNFRKMRLGVF